MNARTFQFDKKVSICLVHSRDRTTAVEACQLAPEDSWVDIRPPSKTREQEERYHAMIGDCAKQCEHLNRRLDAVTWKRLLVDQFRRDTMDIPELAEYWKRNALEFIPSLDGCAIVTLGEQTRQFPRKVATAFIEWLFVWGVDRDVRWSDPTAPPIEAYEGGR